MTLSKDAIVAITNQPEFRKRVMSTKELRERYWVTEKEARQLKELQRKFISVK